MMNLSMLQLVLRLNRQLVRLHENRTTMLTDTASANGGSEQGFKINIMALLLKNHLDKPNINNLQSI